MRYIFDVLLVLLCFHMLSFSQTVRWCGISPRHFSTCLIWQSILGLIILQTTVFNKTNKRYSSYCIQRHLVTFHIFHRMSQKEDMTPKLIQQRSSFSLQKHTHPAPEVSHRNRLRFARNVPSTEQLPVEVPQASCLVVGGREDLPVGGRDLESGCGGPDLWTFGLAFGLAGTCI